MLGLPLRALVLFASSRLHRLPALMPDFHGSCPPLLAPPPWQWLA